MKTEMIIVCAMLQASMSAFSLTDDEARQALMMEFQMQSETDALSANDDTPLDRVTFSGQFGRILASTGWSRGRLFREINTIVSNGCSNAAVVTNAVYCDSIGGAAWCLGKYGMPEEIGCADWLLTNGVDHFSMEIAALLVKRHGLSDGAFAFYRQVVCDTVRISESKRAKLLQEILKSSRFCENTSVTNNLAKLIIGTCESDRRKYGGMDKELCVYWQGYSNSTNRYVNLKFVRDQCDSEYFKRRYDVLIRELAKHQPLPLLPTNTINGVAW